MLDGYVRIDVWMNIESRLWQEIQDIIILAAVQFLLNNISNLCPLIMSLKPHLFIYRAASMAILQGGGGTCPKLQSYNFVVAKRNWRYTTPTRSLAYFCGRLS